MELPIKRKHLDRVIEKYNSLGPKKKEQVLSKSDKWYKYSGSPKYFTEKGKVLINTWVNQVTNFTSLQVDVEDHAKT